MTGITLAALASAWAGLVGFWRGGSPLAVGLTFAGTLAAVAAGQWITRRLGRFVPAVVWGFPAVLVAGSLLDRAFRQGPLGYANASALLLFVSAVAALVFAELESHPLMRVVAWAYLALCALTALQSGADTAFGLIALLPVVASLPVSVRSIRGLLIAGLVAVLAALGGVVAAGVTYNPADRSSAVDQLVDRALSERRVALWHDAVEQVGAYPLTGVGPHRFAAESPTARADPDTPWVHNELLQLAAELGVVGILLGLATLVWCGAVLWQAPPVRVTLLAAAALVGVALNASIDYVLHFPAVVLTTAALVGVASAQQRGRVTVPRGPQP